MTIAIYSKSYFNSHGNLSPDSMRYLELSQNLVDGDGFVFRTNDPNSPEIKEKIYFATWPLGYPSSIYLISKITGVTVFWSSKLLSILIIGLIILLFRLQFQEKAYIYTPIFLFSSFIEIFSFTWSEGLFVFSLVLFSIAIIRLLLHQNNLLLITLTLLLSSLLMFLTRYIGAFSLIVMGLLGIYLFLIKKNLPRSIIVISITVVNFTIFIAYLYNNYIQTGFITGRQRFVDPEPIIHYFFSSLWVLITELNILSINVGFNGIILLFLQFIIIGFIVFKYKKIIFDKKNYVNNYNLMSPFIFLSIGLIYLFILISIRFLGFQIEPLGFRLLAPGTFLIFIAIIKYIDIRSKKIILNIFINTLFILGMFSWILNVPMKTIKNYNNVNYVENINTITKKYSDISNNSIVVFGDRELKYLRPDLELRHPHHSNNPEKRESWAQFIKRIDISNKNIYLFLPPPKYIPLDRFDESVREIINKYNTKKNIVVKLN